MCAAGTTHQLLQVIESTNVLIVEEDLRDSPPPSPFFHFIAALWVLLQVHVHVGHLEIAQELLCASTEGTCRNTENQNLPKKHHLVFNSLQL